ncbi:MAG: exodeoxyribonuclease VII large subunit, partial [Ilumatobacteraceae bacterium]
MSQPAFDFGDADTVDDAVNPTYSVGELADAINGVLRSGFPDGVWVRGEIDSLSNRGPHTYFSLVEHGENGRAVLNVQLFAPMKRNLAPLLKRHRLELAAGMKVRIFGHLDLYAPSGRLGLKMAGIDPRFTLGELAGERDEIVRRLIASGAYDANRSRRLGPVPLRIGVVTSVGSAAWHDFHHEIERSALGFRLAVCDVRVQGDTAVEMIAAAIHTLSRRDDLDAIVVMRGGGARNELATFDAEPIARSIAASAVPVLTGIGHEVDRSVADEVAHAAHKTPTACAGALVADVQGYLTGAEQAWAGIERSARADLDDATARLDDRARRIGRRTDAAVDRAADRLAARVEQLRRRAPSVLDASDAVLDRAADRLARRPVQLLDAEDRHLASLAARVELLDPARLLARGWSITATADGRTVRHPGDPPP